MPKTPKGTVSLNSQNTLQLPNDHSGKELRLILGDQLNAKHSWFRSKREDVVYLIAEIQEEATYTRHHIQKVCGFFLAMENFASALDKAGHNVIYLTLDETQPYPNFPALLNHFISQLKITRVRYQRPDEFRLKQALETWATTSPVETHCDDTEHFILPFEAIEHYLPENKQWRLEFFYRRLRKETAVLMEADEPIGGKWNYDKENREPLPATQSVPEPKCFKHDVEPILARLARHNIKTMGTITNGKLIWPCTRRQSLSLLNFFREHLLPQFGTYQDAMSEQHWSLFHSRLSFSMNCKMLSPMEVIRSVEAAYFEDKSVSIAQAEGFIRQILGWREFVRAIYWRSMPGYTNTNYFEAKRPLPHYFWSGETKMRCMSKAIGQSLEFAYAHHIQRLMVTGNFCLLSGINPEQVHEWYLGIYMDALEWVEAPNTLSMSLFADGGKLASKPYCSGGNYINKMSNHCSQCHYNVKQKQGEQSCPFNSLYWHFLDRHKHLLGKNTRLALTYKNWQRQSTESKQATLHTATAFLKKLDTL